tara:strand:+ start:494 stop:760 length:267 start_codon:yes stop_codon:yes gene_type:complete
MDYLDTCELMNAVLGITDEQLDDEDPEYDQLIFEKFGIDEEQFKYIAESLMKFTIAIESPLTKIKYQGFVDVEAQTFICKQEYKSNHK